MASSKKHEFGFTLAEILITLVVIGVVSAMTIPTIINKKAKLETVTKLQKIYSELSQTVKLSEIDNGPSQNWDWGNDPTSIRTAFDTYWSPYLKILKYCDTYNNCGYNINRIEQINGSLSLYNLSSNRSTSVILKDGSFVRFRIDVGSILLNRSVIVDINASKGPNKFGRDVFMFVINSDGKGLLPITTGIYGPSTVDTNCAKDSYGELCAAKIMKDGWQIKSDYPW